MQKVASCGMGIGSRVLDGNDSRAALDVGNNVVGTVMRLHDLVWLFLFQMVVISRCIGHDG